MYNGWTNFETMSVAEAIFSNNDDYRAMIQYRPTGTQEAKEFVESRRSGIIGLTGRVNWREIATAFEESVNVHDRYGT